MIGEDDSKETRIYIIIAFIIILAVIFAFVFSGTQFKQAYIHHDILDEKWFENLVERDSGSNFLGFEISDKNIKCTSFYCKGCPNHCEVIEARVDGKIVARWNDRCGKYSNLKYD